MRLAEVTRWSQGALNVRLGRGTVAHYPITFVGLDGLPTTDVVTGAPCLSVGFAGALPLEAGQPVRVSRYWALLDTGADYSYADPTVLADVSAPVIGSAGDVNGEGATTIHSGFVVLQDPQITAGSMFIARDFRREGRAPYLIVLGRSFLRIGKLNFDLREPKGGCYFDCDVETFRS